MELDVGGGARGGMTGLDDVRIERALGEVVRVWNSPRFLFEHSDEFMTDAHALFLRIGDAIQSAEKSIGSIDDVQVHLEMAFKDRPYALVLIRAQQPIVNEYTGEPVGNGAMDQRCGHRGIDAPGQTNNDAGVGFNASADVG